MTVAENDEAKQGSNSDLSNASSSERSESKELAHNHQRDAHLHNRSRNSANEKNFLLLDVNQEKPAIISEGNMIKPHKENGFRNESGVKKSNPEDLEMGSLTGENDPPDGGFRAWSIMIGSFLINAILFSVINSYSVVYRDLTGRLKETEEEALFVGSLQMGTTFAMSPIAGIITNKIGIQKTTFLGGLIASLGLFLSALLAEKGVGLYLTYGLMYGVGASLAYAPSLVILGHYFKRYLGKVNGFVTAGSSVFTMIMPFAMKYILGKFALKGLMIGIGALTCIVMPCAFLFKPISHVLSPVPEKPKRSQESTFCNKLKDAVNISILKNTRYLIWIIALPIALIGYQVPYMVIGKLVFERFGAGFSSEAPISCLGLTSGIGRLLFGYIADLPCANRILIQQISILSMGVLMMLMTYATWYPMLLIIYLFMGLCDGCFISLLGPIAVEMCGQKHANSAISLLLGVCAVPIILGSPFIQYISRITGSNGLTFFICGIPAVLGSLLMFSMKFVKEDQVLDSVDPAGQSLTSPTWQTDCGKPTANPVANGGDIKKDGNELQEFHENGSARVLA